MFGAVLCEAAYAVIGKTLTGRLGPKRITVAHQPLGLRAGRRRSASGTRLRFDFGAVRPGIWVLLVFYSLAASVWTVWLWMTGLKAVPAAQAGVFTVMLPVCAALVGVLVLGESLAVPQVLRVRAALLGVRARDVAVAPRWAQRSALRGKTRASSSEKTTTPNEKVPVSLGNAFFLL